jgi:hypothetical protein
VIAKLAMRSLSANPIRSAVLAAGFGTGVSVMAILLGVAEVVLEQARSPALVGGGDLVITGSVSGVTAARVLLTGTLRTPSLAGRIRAASPWSETTLFLVREGGVTPVEARGGIPSLERALGDPEVSGAATWVDAAADAAWTAPDPADILRSIDGFRRVPDVPARAASWAEWLYFNGRSPEARFYLTFLAGPARPDGVRVASVRLQLDRGSGTGQPRRGPRMETFSASAELDEAAIAAAPELTIGANRIRLHGLRYHLTLDLRGEGGARATGDLFIEGAADRVTPPIEIHGAGGWQSGYVVPVMSGVLGGTLVVNGERISLDEGVGYHDHNWGFWEGVSWKWGQVQHGDLSIVYGRVSPPRDAADPDRMPGYLAVIGPDGPLGYATNVRIEEVNAPDSSRPERITIRGRSGSIDLTLTFAVEDLMVTERQSGPLFGALDFLQLRGQYTVAGTAGGRSLSFQSYGSAETFRGR